MPYEITLTFQKATLEDGETVSPDDAALNDNDHYNSNNNKNKDLHDILITGSSDMTARVWNFNTGKCLRVSQG